MKDIYEDFRCNIVKRGPCQHRQIKFIATWPPAPPASALIKSSVRRWRLSDRTRSCQVLQAGVAVETARAISSIHVHGGLGTNGHGRNVLRPVSQTRTIKPSKRRNVFENAV